VPHSYYTLPLQLDRILTQKPVPACTLKSSIAQNLYLLLTTHFGESRFDPAFGCLVWEQDFEILVNIKWKDNIRVSLEEAILRYEKRLFHPKVKLEADEFEFTAEDRIWIKKRLSVWISGTIAKTNEAFTFNEFIYISPMSID
jgi:phage baseplate assembly protein W